MRVIYGGFVAHWKSWQDEDMFLLWKNRTINVESFEAFRILKIYFKKLWAIVNEKGWKDQYMQCLVDEPQEASARSYRVLSCICRQQMPGVVIHDPIESAQLMAGTDIWCVKQALYEKKIEDYQHLQDIGEPMTVYTCGFPAGKTMNRSTDLSLLAGRLPMWLCCKYRFDGFLHWGYCCYTKEPFAINCFEQASGNILPPGDGHIVYPGNAKPWLSPRAHAQRSGAEDYELLIQLKRENPEAVEKLIYSVCRNFDDYTTDDLLFDAVHRSLLIAVSNL